MTKEAVESLRADREALLAMAETFTPDEWAAQSDCAGWTVQDVVAHMAQVFRQMVDPSSLPPGDPSGKTERNQDRFVEAMRSLTPQEVLAEYRALGEQALVGLEGIQEVDSPLPMGDLGTYPLHMVANAFAFDHYTHIRVDILGPTGPLDRPAPPADDLRLRPTLDWMLAGLPQMDPESLRWLDAEVNLTIDGPGARTVHVAPDGEGGVAVREGEAPAGVASVHTTGPDFVVWATKRRDWRSLPVRVEGRTDVAERFCDAVHVF
jgi:uncharacterized protein (TIGR03083 family)